MDPNVILAFLIWIPFAAMWARKRILLRRADSRALAVCRREAYRLCLSHCGRAKARL